MAGNSTDAGRSVTSKVVAILLTFADGNIHSLTEIARLAGLPVSTAHRLATECRRPLPLSGSVPCRWRAAQRIVRGNRSMPCCRTPMEETRI